MKRIVEQTLCYLFWGAVLLVAVPVGMFMTFLREYRR